MSHVVVHASIPNLSVGRQGPYVRICARIGTKDREVCITPGLARVLGECLTRAGGEIDPAKRRGYE